MCNNNKLYTTDFLSIPIVIPLPKINVQRVLTFYYYITLKKKKF